VCRQVFGRSPGKKIVSAEPQASAGDGQLRTRGICIACNSTARWLGACGMMTTAPQCTKRPNAGEKKTLHRHTLGTALGRAWHTLAWLIVDGFFHRFYHTSLPRRNRSYVSRSYDVSGGKSLAGWPISFGTLFHVLSRCFHPPSIQSTPFFTLHRLTRHRPLACCHWANLERPFQCI
jgi:hypothetical protein